MISTSGMLIKELKKFDSDFITVILDQKEYVIENIVHVKNYFDSPSTHLALKISRCGEGNLR